MKPVSTLLRKCDLASLALSSSLGVASPRFVYHVAALMLGTVLPVDETPKLHPLDALFAVAGACFGLLFAFDGYRCSAALDRLGEPHDGTSRFITLIPFVVFFMPAWLPPVEVSLGPFARIAAYVLWPFVLLTVLAFMVAGGQVEAETRGETTRLTLLTTLYHVGGWCGVGLAKQVFAKAKVCERFPTGVPSVMPYVAIGLIAWWVLRSATPTTQLVPAVFGGP